jgi:hypothetical protein
MQNSKRIVGKYVTVLMFGDYYKKSKSDSDVNYEQSEFWY